MKTIAKTKTEMETFIFVLEAPRDRDFVTEDNVTVREPAKKNVHQLDHKLQLTRPTTSISCEYPPCGSLAFSGQMLLSYHLLKLLNVFQVWNKLNGVATAVQSAGPYHPHISHRIACTRPCESDVYSLLWSTLRHGQTIYDLRIHLLMHSNRSSMASFKCTANEFFLSVI